MLVTPRRLAVLGSVSIGQLDDVPSVGVHGVDFVVPISIRLKRDPGTVRRPGGRVVRPSRGVPSGSRVSIHRSS